MKLVDLPLLSKKEVATEHKEKKTVKESLNQCQYFTLSKKESKQGTRLLNIISCR
jgi:hypothetical protein